jgi:GPH family glycoside/pentoside/hexuronide:cation symporter
MALVGVMCFFATFRGTRESVPVVRKHERLTLKGYGTAIFQNRPLLALILMTLFSISAYNIKSTMIPYFTQYYLGDIRMLPYVLFISIGSSVLAILSMPFLTKRFGKKRTALLGFGLAIVADGLNFILPTNPVLFTVLFSLSFIGVMLPNAITWALVSDVIDFGHWKTGVRREGITYSAFNSSRKIAQAIAGGMAGFGLTAVGYVANAHQTPSTLLGIKSLTTLYPFAAFVIAALVLWFLYPLTDDRLKVIVAETHAREADANPDDIAPVA